MVTVIIEKPKKANNWKGGRKMLNGYWLIKKPDYISAYNDGYVREHVYIFQEHHKCCMLPWGDVHHINDIKTDNRIQNLKGILKSKHRRLHMIGNIIKRLDLSSRYCSNCGSKNTVIEKKYNRPVWYPDRMNGFLCNSCYGKWYRRSMKNK